MNYYDVAVALMGSWKTNSFTYSYDGKISIGAVVLCPFGKKEVLGMVTQQVEKPTFKTKPLVLVTEYTLSQSVVDTHDWLQDYYPGALGQTTQNFLPSFLKKPIAELKPSKANKITDLPDLTDAQSKAMKTIEAHKPQPVILHGVTGSGKTRVYMELAKKQLERGKNVLILYPEISLTSQLKKTLSTHFGNGRVHIYHSKRTPKEQRTTWSKSYEASSSEPAIFIGPRSALFLPHSNLGLVVVDECHENSYKQDNGSRYNGLIVAAKIAQTHKAQIIYGSATPPVSETKQILSKSGKLVCMHETAIELANETKSYIIDMTDKNNVSKASYLLSKQLVSQIKDSLAAKRQSLLFINRRGTAKLLLCENCGWHAECDRCDMPMTYHHDAHSMRCHVCGNNKKAQASCPDCSHSLSQKTPGIKAIEAELQKLFPHASIARFDSDNKKADSLSERFDDVASGSIDILIGTQLITKGLDLPLLETVGILQADSGLFLPDYVSEERTFQQLTQVSGRVGRGHAVESNNVFYQTYSPSSTIISHSIKQDWHAFYEKELLSRHENRYPPYAHVMKVWVLKSTATKTEQAIQKIADKLREQYGIQLLGPAPSFYEKSAGNYSWQIVVKSLDRQKLITATSVLPKDALFDLDPTSLL